MTFSLSLSFGQEGRETTSFHTYTQTACIYASNFTRILQQQINKKFRYSYNTYFMPRQFDFLIKKKEKKVIICLCIIWIRPYQRCTCTLFFSLTLKFNPDRPFKVQRRKWLFFLPTVDYSKWQIKKKNLYQRVCRHCDKLIKCRESCQIIILTREENWIWLSDHQ